MPEECLMTAPSRSLFFASSIPHNARINKTPTARGGKLKAAAGRPALTDVRLGRIVGVLSDHATVVISGTKMAKEIGTSRSEVWRLVQQLRRLGVEIAGHPSTGYRLQTMPDLLLPDVLAPLLGGTIFSKHLYHYFKAGSTNTLALEAAAEGVPEGAVFLAEEQTMGRGRGAHTWHSPRSTGIYCSVVLRPHLPPSEILVLSLAAGLAVCSAVDQMGVNLSPELKWPNDLLLNTRKFGGILAEMSAEPTRVRHLVVGIGLNVNQREFPPELSATATSLYRETGSILSRVELVASLLKSLHREYRALLDSPGARQSVLERFQAQSPGSQGRPVVIEENGGFEGVTDGLDSNGFLRVRTVSGVRTVLSGTVRFKA
jgi:BirA family biotin operon repressor/biotin-[acetyl-CoA-carboxylase] ligase